ncbi:hypothetical protein OAA06_02445 [bacterium]|nr:hypothetical protein [bacterium]
MGDLSFYKSGGQYLARTKGGVDTDRIKNDPAFVRTRENGSEFGKASKLLRTVLMEPILKASDKKVSNRLTTQLLKVIQTDATNVREERTVIGGDLNLLKGFEFNMNASLESVVRAPYTVGFDRTTGEVAVSIVFNNPSEELLPIEGATHAKFTVGIAAVNFESKEYEGEVVPSAEMLISDITASTIDLTASISANNTQPVFVVLGVEYYQLVNGSLYLIMNKESIALLMVEIDIP